MYNKFTAIIEKDEDGMYVGRVPQLRGCVSQGKTIDELIKRLKDAAKLCLDEENDIEINEFVGTQQIEI